jgi:PAS domain S-box-containing protein
LYLVAGLLWIGLSDRFLYRLANYYNLTSQQLIDIGIWKGYFYIILTALLLYLLIWKNTRSLVTVKNDFQRLFEENPNPMWIYDLTDLKILLVNDPACRQYGYTNEEFLKLNLFHLRPLEERTKLQNNLRTIQFGFSDSGEWLHQSKAGEKFYVHIYSHEIIYKKRNCRIVTAINVHERKQAEIERKNIQQALDNSALVTITDAKGTILEANPKFCLVSKYEPEEIIGKNHNIVNSAHHPPEFWMNLWKTISSGRSWRGDILNRAKDDTFYWVDTVITPIFNTEGKIYKYMSVRYEITKRKHLEETQRKLLDDFAQYTFLTSHQLRGPLARMLGLITLFKDYPDQGFVIDKMKETGNELDSVIQKMNMTLNRNAYQVLIEKREAESKMIS